MLTLPKTLAGLLLASVFLFSPVFLQQGRMMAHPQLDITVELQQQWRNNQLTLKPVFAGAEGQFNYLMRVTKQGSSGAVTTQQAGQLSLQGVPLTASSVTLNLSPDDHCKVVLELLQHGQSLLTHTFECVVPAAQ